MNQALYKLYRERRTDDYKAIHAYLSARNELARRWQVELRGWDWDTDVTNDRWNTAHELDDGSTVEYRVVYDPHQSFEERYGVKYVERGWDHVGIGRNGMRENRFTLAGDRRNDVSVYTLDGWSDTTPYYHKMGYAKQPAFQKAAAVFRKQVEAVRDDDYTTYGVQVRVVDTSGEERYEDACRGITLDGTEDDRQYLREMLDECYDSVMAELQKK